jgi:hypothetical protein
MVRFLGFVWSWRVPAGPEAGRRPGWPPRPSAPSAPPASATSRPAPSPGSGWSERTDQRKSVLAPANGSPGPAAIDRGPDPARSIADQAIPERRHGIAAARQVALQQRRLQAVGTARTPCGDRDPADQILLERALGLDLRAKRPGERLELGRVLGPFERAPLRRLAAARRSDVVGVDAVMAGLRPSLREP